MKETRNPHWEEGDPNPTQRTGMERARLPFLHDELKPYGIPPMPSRQWLSGGAASLISMPDERPVPNAIGTWRSDEYPFSLDFNDSRYAGRASKALQNGTLRWFEGKGGRTWVWLPERLGGLGSPAILMRSATGKWSQVGEDPYKVGHY
ncbi:hypothetical protein F4Y59_06350, partial [Candidatus Poribacteria bacterium]|nr:hypothetical protein [Candidatus Poribacteria bacterium]